MNQIGFDSLKKSEIYNPVKLDFYSDKDKICDLDLTQFNSETEKYTTLKRSFLIKFLKDKLFSNLIRFNKTVEKVEKNQNTIKISFKDGSSDEVDYLVVSDGVYSQTKSIIEKKTYRSNYYGSLAIRTTVRSQDITNFNKKNISLLMSSNAHLVLYPVNEKEHNVVVIARNKKRNFFHYKNLNFIKTILNEGIIKNNNSLRPLFNGQLSYWPIYTSKEPKNSKIKNVFYLGDAFYAFSPTMAQGASQSIEGAEELQHILEKNINDKQNLYFTNRFNRTRVIKKRSNFNYFAFHLSNKVLVFFRNLILKIIINRKEFIKNYLGKVFRK